MNGGEQFRDNRRTIRGPPGGRASDPYIAMAENFFHPTHPRTHIHIRLTLLTLILIVWEKIVRATLGLLDQCELGSDGRMWIW